MMTTRLCIDTGDQIEHVHSCIRLRIRQSLLQLVDSHPGEISDSLVKFPSCNFLRKKTWRNVIIPKVIISKIIKSKILMKIPIFQHTSRKVILCPPYLLHNPEIRKYDSFFISEIVRETRAKRYVKLGGKLNVVKNAQDHVHKLRFTRPRPNISPSNRRIELIKSPLRRAHGTIPMPACRMQTVKKETRGKWLEIVIWICSAFISSNIFYCRSIIRRKRHIDTSGSRRWSESCEHDPRIR